jgi:hypothetical protein
MSESSTLPVAAEVPAGETAELLLKAIRSADEPLSLAQIVKSLPRAVRPSEERASAVIGEQIERGNVFEYPPLRGHQQYWCQPRAELARRQLLRKVERGPLTQAEVLGTVRKLTLLRGMKESDLKEILAELQGQGLIHKLPSYLGGRTPLFSSAPANPVDYVKDALQKLSKKLGVAEQEFLDRYLPSAAPGPSEPAEEFRAEQDDRILEAMRELDPGVDQGSMILIADLRRQLSANFPGDEFDSALLDESAAGRVCLHPTDRAALLPEEEQRALLRDENGVAYNTVTLRTS